MYKEVPESLLDEIDVDSDFCYNICDISQSHHLIVRFSGCSKKKKIAVKFFRFYDIKRSNDTFSKKEYPYKEKKCHLARYFS